MDTSSLIKEDRIYYGEKITSSIIGAGITEQLLIKNEIRRISNRIHKNKLKKD